VRLEINHLPRRGLLDPKPTRAKVVAPRQA